MSSLARSLEHSTSSPLHPLLYKKPSCYHWSAVLPRTHKARTCGHEVDLSSLDPHDLGVPSPGQADGPVALECQQHRGARERWELGRLPQGHNTSLHLKLIKGRGVQRRELVQPCALQYFGRALYRNKISHGGVMAWSTSLQCPHLPSSCSLLERGPLKCRPGGRSTREQSRCCSTSM